jgi:hypothetical protein
MIFHTNTSTITHSTTQTQSSHEHPHFYDTRIRTTLRHNHATLRLKWLLGRFFIVIIHERIQILRRGKEHECLWSRAYWMTEGK